MTRKRILITGGPVHAHLDDVKIITNRFRGGLMAQLAEDLLGYDTEIAYLYAPEAGAKAPQGPDSRLKLVAHKGYDDYRIKVRELAPKMDGVILGAAVANLIPTARFPGKFPSHNYKPGDIIPIDFTVAPRVIEDVKKVAPKTQLFGYKLLSGVAHEELIRAAYGIVLEARAVAVIANDAKDLQKKYVVTKERGVHPMEQKDLALWIMESLNDEYYSSKSVEGVRSPIAAAEKASELIDLHKDRFAATESGLIFGTVAVRHGSSSSFVTTGRGKRELDSLAYVTHVAHQTQEVFVGGRAKASLNAPLLARLFENPDVHYILHFHEQVPGLPDYSYAPPGTRRDTMRSNETSFNIREHGCMLLFNEKGQQL